MKCSHLTSSFSSFTSINSPLPGIKAVTGSEVIDSRGNPTVSASVILTDGSTGTAIAPSGASTGSYEALELRDGGSRYNGLGVAIAVGNINGLIQRELTGLEKHGQRIIDEALCKLDGTDNKSVLGANAILPVSLAYARACASFYGLEPYEYIGGVLSCSYAMPTPMMNVLNGGAHSQNNLDIQEFMLVPTAAFTIREAVRKCCEIYHRLGKLLNERHLASGVGDEGGFAPSLNGTEAALELLLDSIRAEGFDDEIKLALDAAASEWQTEKPEFYRMPKNGTEYSSDELIQYWLELAKQYPVISIEDGLGEDDSKGWRTLTDKAGKQLLLVGDDVFVTNCRRISSGIANGIANAVLIKPNQTGTLSETLDAITTARNGGYKIVVSHRSGETEDTFIADLAVGIGADYVKFGAPCRSERTAKYNRLLEIEALRRG